MQLCAVIMRELQGSRQLLKLCFLLLQFRSQVLEAIEDWNRSQNRIP